MLSIVNLDVRIRVNLDVQKRNLDLVSSVPSVLCTLVSADAAEKHRTSYLENG